MRYLTIGCVADGLRAGLLEHWCQLLQVEMQQFRARQESLLAQWEAERQRIQALEAQQEGLLEFVKRLGEKQGWVILAQLLAPAAAPPPPRRESTPMSMSTVVLLYVLMLSVKPSNGLRVGFVDVTAFVPDLLICRPSCQKCGCRPSCRPSSCKFSKPPQLPKLSTFIYT
jgi:hypothetical protein